MFRLLDIPWWYYTVTLLIGVVVGRTWRWEGGLLAGYAFLLLAETVLIRGVTPDPHFRSQLFWSWRAWDEQRTQILTNIAMFIPVGVIAGLIWRWKGLLVAIGMSFVIEVLQLITDRGLCEFDDVIHNTLGALTGVGLVMLIRNLLKIEECR